MLTINTLVLGMRAYGKTCALATTHAIMSKSVHRFVLTAQERNQRAELNKMWANMVNGGLLPDTSVAGRTYNLVFSRNFKPICQLNWHDYPGGWAEQDSAQQEQEQLLEWMTTADCIILVAPADDIVEKYRYGERMEAVAPYNNLFVRYGLYCQENFGDIRYVPIAYMITKSDLVQDKELLKDAIAFNIEHEDNPLYDPEDKWEIGVIPVTLGENLKRLDGIDGKNCIDTRTLSPVGIHLPVLYSLCKRLTNELFEKIQVLKDQQESLDRIVEEITALEDRRLVWGKRGKIRTKQDVAAERQSALEGLIKNSDKLKTHLDAVRRELIDGIPLSYFRGQPVDVDEILGTLS